MLINELFQPIFDALPFCPPFCPHCTPAHLRKCHIWEEYARCIELKLTLRQAASICHINFKTAFLWLRPLKNKIHYQESR